MRRRTPARTSIRTSTRTSRRTPARPRIRTAAVIGAAAAALLAAAVAAPAQGAPAPSPAAAGSADTQRVEYFTGPDSHPKHTEVPASEPLSRTEKSRIADDGDVTPIVENGPVDAKLDVVFLGDGYTADQQEDFHDDVRAKWGEVAEVEPYASYPSLFNVWSVDAVSNESGVSGDPTADVVRDTALGSAFFCNDTERLLCVDTGKVESYAAKAPAADLVIVLSNTTKYGGAGYSGISSPVGYDGIATASSDHPDSDQIVVHETGHSLGRLADEYDYGQPGTYTGPEPGDSNLSTLSAEEMAGQQTKWHNWLGEESPDGGTVGTYEGGGYYQFGLNRPTEDSIMRTLGREFNLPGREAMIAGFYRYGSVLTSPDAGPDAGTLAAGDRLRVDAPGSAQVRWLVDGTEVRSARGETAVSPRSLGVPADGRTHTVTATATDGTDAVRDPALRGALSGELEWQVKG